MVAVFVVVSAGGMVVAVEDDVACEVSVVAGVDVELEEVEESVVMAEVEVAESEMNGEEVEVSVVRVWEDIEVLEVED